VHEPTRPHPSSDLPGQCDVTLSVQLLHKQQKLRRLLRDPASPAFGDPIRAAELAGFLKSCGNEQEDGGSLARFITDLSVPQAILHAASRKAATIDTVQGLISKGFEATKLVTVTDHNGNERKLQVADQIARLRWARFSVELEGLVPGRGGNASGNSLPHEAVQAAYFERQTLATDYEHEVLRMNPIDRHHLSNLLTKRQHVKEALRRKAIEDLLGKKIAEFEKEVEAKMVATIRQEMSQSAKPTTSCTNPETATDKKNE
jgi:hypothetical protein